MKITPTTKSVVTGITIELTPEDVVHLNYALSLALERGMGANRRQTWTWLDRFIAALDKAWGLR